MRRTAGRLLIALAAPVLFWGHVGSPDVFYEGAAGPYPVRVIIRTPGVVPGLADITVRAGGTGVSRVTVQPVRWDVGREGAPPPDLAKPVRGDSTLYTAALWLMTASSYSVRVEIAGDAGTGAVLVPVAAVPTRRLAMQRALGAVLLVLGAGLFAGFLTIVGAAVRESVLPLGDTPDRRLLLRARAVVAVAAVLIGVLVLGGKKWWDVVDAAYRRNIYTPFHVTTKARLDGPQRILSLAIDDERWLGRKWTPLIPEHGKLMHLFLFREPGLDVFAHVHPVPLSQDAFEAAIPPLPSGTYRVYGDITHESGFPQTLTDVVRIPDAPAAAAGKATLAPDPDDSWRVARALTAAAAAAAPAVDSLDEGLAMSWAREPASLVAGRETTLRFEVEGPDGQPAALEPYMGMMAHAVISRDDGAVFVHLHPSGTISMASQKVFEERALRAATGQAAATGHAAHVRPSSHVVSLPYEFPRPGLYRIWVQVKSGGKVRTGVFDAEVAAGT